MYFLSLLGLCNKQLYTGGKKEGKDGGTGESEQVETWYTETKKQKGCMFDSN